MHWEYRMNPLVDREKVRAFAMRHTCTHPTLCLSPLRGALSLDRSHASVSFLSAMFASGTPPLAAYLQGSGLGRLFGAVTRCAGRR